MSLNAGVLGGRGGGRLGVSTNENSCAHGAQIYFADPIPDLTYIVVQMCTYESVTSHTTNVSAYIFHKDDLSFIPLQFSLCLPMQ
jgi:hypothetical protein